MPLHHSWTWPPLPEIGGPPSWCPTATLGVGHSENEILILLQNSGLLKSTGEIRSLTAGFPNGGLTGGKAGAFNHPVHWADREGRSSDPGNQAHDCCPHTSTELSGDSTQKCDHKGNKQRPGAGGGMGIEAESTELSLTSALEDQSQQVNKDLMTTQLEFIYRAVHAWPRSLTSAVPSGPGI